MYYNVYLHKDGEPFWGFGQPSPKEARMNRCKFSPCIGVAHRK